MNALKINASGIIGSQAIIEILGKGSETRGESKGYISYDNKILHERGALSTLGVLAKDIVQTCFIKYKVYEIKNS